MADDTDPRAAPDRTSVARVDVAHHASADPPHTGGLQTPVSPVSAPASTVTRAAAGKDPDATAEQLERHANELSEQLRARYRELSRWEATLHAQRARWEDEQRANRIWVSEQTVALAERETRLQAWAEQLERRAQELERTGASAEAVRRHQQELDQRAAQLDQLEQQLHQQQEQVRQQAAWLDAAQRSLVSTATPACDSTGAARPETDDPDTDSSADSSAAGNTETRRDFTARVRALESLEKLTRDRLQWLAQAQADFDQHYQTWLHRARHQRRHLAQMWRQRRRALREQVQQLQHQQRQLHARRQSLRSLARRLTAFQLDGRSPADSPSATIAAMTMPPDNLEAVAADQAGIGRLMQLADELARQRRALAKSQQALDASARHRARELRQREHELEQTLRAIEKAEVRLAEARRDAIYQWQREQIQIRKWLEMLRRPQPPG